VADTDRMADSSASTSGASGGSLGGASIADVKRGYSDAGTPKDDSHEAICCCPLCAPQKRGGFLDRPTGWER
jgi:hypothetical protein